MQHTVPYCVRIMGVLCFYLGFGGVEAQECGVSPVKEDRIVGGTDALDGSWPWQVDIQVSLSQTNILHFNVPGVQLFNEFVPLAS